jgi:hypothetical protein
LETKRGLTCVIGDSNATVVVAACVGVPTVGAVQRLFDADENIVLNKKLSADTGVDSIPIVQEAERYHVSVDDLESNHSHGAY